MLTLLSYRLKRLNRGVRAKLSLLAPRFGTLTATPVPLMKLEYAGRRKNRTLMIFLPGIDDVAEDFERRGFIHALRREGVAVDAVAVDAHYGYYAKRALFERITDDVIASAHTAGYEEIWLVGISLGGFGAVSYAARHVSRISGVVLLAPYLGDKALIREITEAGGVKGWEPGHVPEGDFQRSLWTWFKRHVSASAPTMPIFKHHVSASDPAMPIYIGYGTGDMFASANALLADILPHDRVFAIPGRHDWRTWKQIWRMFLAQWEKYRD
jgi:pimeloyl-ACP methyl ester carboxylesterase